MVSVTSHQQRIYRKSLSNNVGFYGTALVEKISFVLWVNQRNQNSLSIILMVGKLKAVFVLELASNKLTKISSILKLTSGDNDCIYLSINMSTVLLI